jgi:putative ABC transport system permease protein
LDDNYAGPRVYATAIGAPAGAPARAADATTAAAEKPEPAGKAGASDPDDRSISVLRVATTEHDPAVRRDVLRQAAVALTGAGMSVEQAYTVDTLKAALDGHVLVLADALLVIGLLMGFVGLLGLASTLGTTVTERTSEFGVLHALGAGRARVAGQVVLEGIATAVGGVAVAAVAAVPLTVVFARIVGVQAFRQPLPWQYSVPAVTVWFVVAVLGAAVAASGAASRASRLTVRQAMSAV